MFLLCIELIMLCGYQLIVLLWTELLLICQNTETVLLSSWWPP